MPELKIDLPNQVPPPPYILSTDQGALLVNREEKSASWGMLHPFPNFIVVLCLTPADEECFREALEAAIANGNKMMMIGFDVAPQSNKLSRIVLPGGKVIVLDPNLQRSLLTAEPNRELKELQREVRALRTDQKVLTAAVLQALKALDPNAPRSPSRPQQLPQQPPSSRQTDDSTC